MIAFSLWALAALGFAVVVVRQRTIAVAAVTLQALVLVALSFEKATGSGEVVAAVALGARAVGLAALFIMLAARTRESTPVRAGADPFARAILAVAVALLLTWLLPTLGLQSREAERAALTLVAFGLVTAATRRATLLQVVGIVLAENGLALAALELPGARPIVIELGVAVDLTLIGLVAAAFHSRIFAALGSGDSSLLRSLRD